MNDFEKKNSEKEFLLMTKNISFLKRKKNYDSFMAKIGTLFCPKT